MKFLQILTLFSLFLTLSAENLLTTNRPQNIWPHGKTTLSAKDGKLSVSVPHGSTCHGSITIRPEWKFLRLDMEMRVKDLRPGAQSWQCGRLAMRFYGADRKPVGKWPEMFGMSGNSDWTRCSRIYEIPEGAVLLAIDPANFGKSGIAEFRNLTVQAFRTRKEAEEFYTGPRLPSTTELWDLKDAERLRNAFRDRLCLNTIWQVRPVDAATADSAPKANEYPYFFKVPGIWPGHNGWKQPGTSQDFYHPSGAKAQIDGKKLNHVWYRRTVEIPADWKDRKIELELTWIQTCGQLFIDGKKAGEFYFPGGRVDLTGKLIPGRRHELAILVSARVEDAETVSFNAPDRISRLKKKIVCRGITGDVYLHAGPRGTRISDIHLITSVRNREITCDVGLQDIVPGTYTLETVILDGDQTVKTLRSPLFLAVPGKRILFKAPWTDPKLWDTDTPQNTYRAVVTLKDARGNAVDTLYPQEFGFREFEIDGRDFKLNGKRLHLRSAASQLPIRGAENQTAGQYRKNAEIMKSFGLNHLIPLNYNFSPGETGYQDAFYVENSRNGILTTLTLPHPASFDWKLDDPAVQAKYRMLTGYLIRRYQNVPGLILYASTHNATGYSGDQNPARIDGVYTPDPFLKKNAKQSYLHRRQALLAADLVKQLDPTRPVYHHESGNLGPMYTINCYLNWAPLQERSDWLEHWETHGVKPLYMMEWGMPHVCSWSSFRGPAFIWSANAVQCIWLNEYNAQFLGEEAYRASGQKISMMKAQEKLNTGNREVHFSRFNWFSRFTDVQKVWSILIGANFRDLRARGLSGLLPWDGDAYWNADRAPKSRPLPDRFSNLKRTGMSPDYQGALADRFDTGTTFTGKTAGAAFQPRLGWIAGKIGDFTSRNSYYLPGETLEKSLVILNDTRRDLTTRFTWSVPEWKISGSGTVVTKPGGRTDLPISFRIPDNAAGQKATLHARFSYSGNKTAEDTFPIEVGTPAKVSLKRAVYLVDPEGSAGPLLRKLKIPFRSLRGEKLPEQGILILGRNALRKAPASLENALRSGLRLLVLEQPYEDLLNLGIRGNVHGFREIFALDPSFADKPLKNWRGASTNLPHYLETPDYEPQMPKWNWNGFSNTRVWRAGNRGTVSGVVAEKPCVGDWMPLLQAGFDLQYAPLLEYREGKSRVLFCQLDVSGRTEESPEALELLAEALRYLDRSETPEPRRSFYLGNAAGEETLKTLKLKYQPLKEMKQCTERDLLILGPGSKTGSLKELLSKGLHVLALGLDAQEMRKILPGLEGLSTGKGVYSDYAEGLADDPVFRGISNADLHWRKGLNGTFFAKTNPGGKALRSISIGKGKIVFCQVAPWMFDPNEFQYRTTRRRNFYLLSRLAHNLGAESDSAFLKRLSKRSALRDGYRSLKGTWLGKADPKQIGREKGYFRPDFRTDRSWRPVKVPGMFDLQFRDIDPSGNFWYRTTFDAADLPANTDVTLYLGAIDDESWVWFNGEFLGELSVRTNPKNFWAAERIYTLRHELLKPTGNVLTVLCNNRRMSGGILGEPNLTFLPEYRLYSDLPISGDDPYRYFRW